MQDATNIKAFEGKYLELLDDLDERGRHKVSAGDTRCQEPFIDKAQ